MKEKMHMNVRSTWGTFTIVPHEILESDLSPRAVLVFIALMSRVSHTEGDAKCWPSYEAIRERCAVKAKASINAGLDELEEKGFLKRERRFSSSTVYTLTRPSVVQNMNHSSSEDEPLPEVAEVQIVNHSSSDSEPQKFTIRTLTRTKNKKQRTRTNDSSRREARASVPDQIVDIRSDSELLNPPQEDDPFAFIPGVDDKPAAPVEEKPKRARKSKATLSPEEAQRHAELFDGIVRVCVVDAKLCGGHIARTAKQLREADPDANGAAMDAFLEWWKTSDFRGKQGKPPTIAQIPTSWKMFRDGYAEINRSHVGSKSNDSVIDRIMRSVSFLGENNGN
jgi:hypothetical protein